MLAEPAVLGCEEAGKEARAHGIPNQGTSRPSQTDTTQLGRSLWHNIHSAISMHCLGRAAMFTSAIGRNIMRTISKKEYADQEMLVPWSRELVRDMRHGPVRGYCISP